VVLRPATVVASPDTVALSPVLLVCIALRLVLIVLRLLARLVTELIAMGSVAYWFEPEPPPVVVVPEPSVLVIRTAASVNAVVLGGTCHVSVHDTVPLLLV